MIDMLDDLIIELFELPSYDGKIQGYQIFVVLEWEALELVKRTSSAYALPPARLLSTEQL